MLTNRNFALMFGVMGALQVGQVVGLLNHNFGLFWTSVYMQIPLSIATTAATGWALHDTRRPALWVGLLAALALVAASTSWIWLSGPAVINIFGVVAGVVAGILALGVAAWLRVRR